MELTKKEERFISRAGRFSTILLISGFLMILVPTLFLFYLKGGSLERVEKIFPEAGQARSLLEHQIEKFEQNKSKIENKKELELVSQNLELQKALLSQAHRAFVSMVGTLVYFVQLIGFINIAWALDRRRLVKIFNKKMS